MSVPSEAERGDFVVRTVTSIEALDARGWDAIANCAAHPYNPFVAHAFLRAIEASGCVGGGTGWRPCHVVIEDPSGKLIAAAPCYVKTHSQGEYVFDHAWADAFERAGGRYYPKLLVAVPFTPVPGAAAARWRRARRCGTGSSARARPYLGRSQIEAVLAAHQLRRS